MEEAFHSLLVLLLDEPASAHWTLVCLTWGDAHCLLWLPGCASYFYTYFPYCLLLLIGGLSDECLWVFFSLSLALCSQSAAGFLLGLPTFGYAAEKALGLCFGFPANGCVPTRMLESC